MRKKFGKLLIAAFFCLLFSAAEAAGAEKQYLKIGLNYGSNALSSANLASEEECGFEFGYYDPDFNFISIHTVSDEKISVMKNKAMYLANDGSYYDYQPANVSGRIGEFRLRLSGTYSTVKKAVKAAHSVNASGLNAYAAYIGGEYIVRIGAFNTREEAEKARKELASNGFDAEEAGLSETCYTVAVTKTTTVLFEFDNNTPFGIRPYSDSKICRTWFKGNIYCGGFEYNRVSGNDITVINVVSMDDYIKGVIPYEMNPAWPAEALKAQALCAKSYALASKGKHRSSGFDLCNTDDCQVYKGCALATEASDAAVDSVSGLAVMYNGNIAKTFFHSSDGGATEDAKNVWGTDIPYLKAVRDGYENLEKATNGIWTKTITPAQVKSILNNKGYEVSNVVNLYVDEYTDTGNVYRLAVKDSRGKVTSFEQERARLILNSSESGTFVHSLRYTVTQGEASDFYAADLPIYAQAKQYAIGAEGVRLTGNAVYKSSMITSEGIKKQEIKQTAKPSVFTITGRGWGHNVGMSQWGARGMAEQGFTYDRIIKFYYTGVDIENLGQEISDNE